MKSFVRSLFLIICVLPSLVHAVITDELMMIRSAYSFPETMSLLQEAIKKQGYTLSRVQRVDIGLTASGYQTDKYRVVFFGKTGEVHKLVKEHPEFIPYLPLKIAIFAEGDETILVCSNPAAFTHLFADDDLHVIFKRWEKDLTQILNYVQFYE